MGFNLFGSDNPLQSQDSLSNAVNFNPQHILGSGSGNYLSSTPTFAYTSEQTAKQEAGTTADVGASLGLGFGGGSGSGGQVDKTNSNSSYSDASANSNANDYLPYIFAGGAVIMAGFFILKGKK
ncbi:MAG: hypothetical protein LBT96_05425 [Campylobacteraceae bacterium]|jgi:hypothetical protein|nr:hypothetical protein [Campylobacteraceae bacterium]